MRRRAWIGLVALGFAAPPAHAQDSLRLLAAMEARLDSLRRTAARADSTAITAAISDTVAVGGLRIVTSRTLRPVAVAAAGEAWDSLTRRYGAPALARATLSATSLGGPATVLPARLDVHALADGLARAVASALWRQQDAALVDWLGGRFPVAPPVGEEYALLAARTAVSPGQPNTACLQGDLDACVMLMNQPLPTPPLDLAGREMLVGMALELGGEGAFSRLTTEPSHPISQRLASAAGLPLDDLLGRWLARVRAAAPGSPAPGAREVLGALAACAAILLLAVRGSRWA